LLPDAKNPNDPKQVFDSLERLSKKLGKKTPTITIKGETHPLTGLTLKEDGVKIHTPQGTNVSYPVLLEALQSVVQTR